jgi:Hint domain
LPTYSFWANTTSPTAQASTLVVGNNSATLITFTTDSPLIGGPDDTGDLTLESTGGAPDPDTWVTINGTTYSFTYDVVGSLPTGHNKVPDVLEGKNVAVITLSNGDKYFYVTDGSGTQGLMLEMGGGNIKLDAPNENPPPVYVCFCSGTLIATPSGKRGVETLVAGDMVLTAEGHAKPVIWVGATRVSRAALLASESGRPITIAADSFGPGRPSQDLHVSPQHRVLIQGPLCELLFGEAAVLVPAKFLVGELAEVATPEADVEYYHILLEDHDMLLSNGLPTESFQPARRTMDVMGADARQMLEAVIATLGEAPLLSRKDSFLSLRQPEAEVLLSRLQNASAGRLTALTPLQGLAH